MRPIISPVTSPDSVSSNPNSPSPVTVNESDVENQGFTRSGLTQYSVTVRDYSQQLLERAVHLGDADKAPGMQREITHDHVRASAHSMARSFGKPSRSRGLVVAQVGEYVATALAGVGGGTRRQKLGHCTFGFGCGRWRNSCCLSPYSR